MLTYTCRSFPGALAGVLVREAHASPVRRMEASSQDAARFMASVKDDESR